MTASDSEHDRVKSYVSEAWTGEAPNRTRQQQCMELNSVIVNTVIVTGEINKIATVSNNRLQFKIPGHVLSRNRSTQEITRVYDVTDNESFTM